MKRVHSMLISLVLIVSILSGMMLTGCVSTNPGQSSVPSTDPSEDLFAPTGSAPTQSDPEDTSPSETQPDPTEPSQTDPPETQPPETEPVETEPLEPKMITLSTRFADGMIFQQNKPWQVKGTGEAGETITVKLLNKNSKIVQTQKATVDADGAWAVSMAGVTGSYDAYSIRVSCGSTVKTVSDVVFGEVWAAGGQSNMAYAVYRSSDAVMTTADMNALKDSLASNDKASYIRFFMNGQSYVRDDALTNPVGSWGNGSDWSEVRGCSATAFLFAMELQKKLNVPVGVVVAAKGGTGITSWVDTETGKSYSDYYAALSALGYNKYNASDADNSQRHYLSGWYNSQVASWAGYEVKGILWYQGEQDRSQTEMQSLGIPALVASWSKTFNSEANASGEMLPFIAIQIAPYNTTSSDPSMTVHFALNNAMQAGVAKVAESGSMAVCVPIYDFRVYVNNIHPVNKPEIGLRTAQTAYGLVYNKTANCTGPVLESIDYSNASSGYITLKYSNTGSGLKYIQLTAEDNFRLSDSAKTAASIDVALYADKLEGFSVWTGTQIISVEAQIVNATTVKLLLPQNADGSYSGVTGVYYGYGQQILTANLYNGSDYPALPFFVERNDGANITHKTPLWNVEENSATVLKDNNARDGRNTSRISIVSGVGYGNSMALQYELLTAGCDRTHTWTWSNAGKYGFDTNVTAAANDDILWFWLEANVSSVQRLQFAINDSTILQSENSYIYTLTKDASGNVQLITIPYGGNDSVDGISLVKYPNNQKEAQIQIHPGWSGWVGISVDMFCSKGDKVLQKGDTISKLSVLLFQVVADGSALTEQKVGDNVVLDEFWLTSAGCYPAIADIVVKK